MSPLERRKPLGRSKGLRPQSARARARARQQERVAEAVLERDGHCRLVGIESVLVDGELVVVPGCFGHLTPHHLAKSSQVGAEGDTEANEMALCVGHNEWVEACPRAVAVALGVAAPAKHDLTDHPRPLPFLAQVRLAGYLTRPGWLEFLREAAAAGFGVHQPGDHDLPEERWHEVANLRVAALVRAFHTRGGQW